MANRRIKKKKLKKYEQQVPKKKLRAKRKVKKFAGSRKVSTPVSIKDKNEYYKQRKRLQSKISYYKKLGYKINYDIPKIPEKISSSAINKLKRANKNFKKYLSRVDIETGQIIKGHKYGWKIPRSRRPKIDVSKPIVSGEIPTLHNIALDEWFTYVAALFYGKAYDAFLKLNNKVIYYNENYLI